MVNIKGKLCTDYDDFDIKSIDIHISNAMQFGKQPKIE